MYESKRGNWGRAFWKGALLLSLVWPLLFHTVEILWLLSARILYKISELAYPTLYWNLPSHVWKQERKWRESISKRRLIVVTRLAPLNQLSSQPSALREPEWTAPFFTLILLHLGTYLIFFIGFFLKKVEMKIVNIQSICKPWKDIRNAKYFEFKCKCLQRAIQTLLKMFPSQLEEKYALIKKDKAPV